ncbi:antitoxin [Candidatus Endobugula sertula]|uniref:Antitoxin n=1 Tax=Candidatus Endobugula sertula TaxID=62101 RepID=A0A1D2QPR9_9GAMM|nr:antitoxin [Candidatus Endobugula sertula]
MSSSNKGTVFENNRTQAVRLPAGQRFPKGVKNVIVRKRGNERILSPVDHSWDSFFLDDDGVSDDFMVDRPEQHQQDRESL